jgi:hypothetical protein
MNRRLKTAARMPVPKFDCELACACGIAWFVGGDVPYDGYSIMWIANLFYDTRKREFRNALMSFGYVLACES